MNVRASFFFFFIMLIYVSYSAKLQSFCDITKNTYLYFITDAAMSGHFVRESSVLGYKV